MNNKFFYYVAFMELIVDFYENLFSLKYYKLQHT